jgi:signal transduction histidine kinase
VKNPSGERIFHISRGQRILVVVVVFNLLVLSFFMLISSRFSSAETKVFSSTQTTSSSVVITQRETLAYTTKYAQWIGGQITKREVQIAKAFLAQRLSVINSDGVSTGELASPQFIDLLRETGALLNEAPDGLLPEALQQKFAREANEAIEGLLFNSRQLTRTYQQKLDSQLLATAQERSRNTLNSLMALISFIILISLLVVWGTASFRTQYRVARKTLRDEEKALRISEAKLKESESTIKTLEALDISKSDFISTVNHELRTPLTSIIGYIDVLKTLDLKKDIDQLPQITTVIDRNSEVLLDIIESILSLSSLDSPGKPARFERVSLIEIIDRKIFVMSPQIHEKSLSVNFHHELIDDFEVTGNSGQLSQVVLNLLSNAVKFSPDNGSIDIYLSVISKDNSQDFVQLEIKDHGIGIPKDEIPKLFARFFRASNATDSQITGTGLGLAIVARILELHQASVRVESELNKGTSFFVEFPRTLSETQQHVSKNRANVLYKAIVAIKASEPDGLIDICHQMSGTLGFYDSEKEMHLINDFQRWLEANGEASTVLVNLTRGELVAALEDSYSALDNGMDRKS